MNPGEKLGPYEIVEPLGAGGMGEVYRARDPRLDRDVAIKVLPEDFAADAGRLARFEREAKLLAQLNHSNIAGIYGLEDADGVRFIAMECVDGETLAERLGRYGRIEIDDALEIARQIAEALEAAHESGIVHRDLKPANVVVAPDGKVKVLDFGLAKAWEADAVSGSAGAVGGGTAGSGAAATSPEGATAADLSHSPTVLDATRTGVILGTAAYMSPEQARGKPVDKRTDIWAFGCVLYEMLSGKRAFAGETVSDTMAAILKEEPDWSALAAHSPPVASRLIRRCLDKDPRQRLRDIGEARVVLSSGGAEELAVPARGDAPAVTIPRRLDATTVGAVAMAAALAFAAGVAYRSARTVVDPYQNLPIATAADTEFGYWYRPVLALSPDGRWLAYVAESAGVPQLYLQDLVETAPARLIPKSAEAEAPFFSPGSESIAFFQGVTVQVARVESGEPTEVARIGGTSHPGGGFSEDGTILVVPSFGGPVQRIDPRSGAVVQTLEPETGEQFFYPSALPGGERFLLSLNSNSRRNVFAVSWDGDRRLLVDGGYYARYVPTGHLLWMRDNELVVATFDLDTLTVGDEQVVARSVVADRQESFGEYGVANDGTIAYLQAEPGGEWLQLLQPGQPPVTLNSAALDLAYLVLDVSPQGDLVAYSDKNLPPNIRSFDLTRRLPGPALVTSPNIDFNPVFTPDGARVLYTAIREDYTWAFYETTPNTPGDPLPVLENDVPKWANNWHPDGETLAYVQENVDTNTGTDVMVFTPASGEEPSGFVDTSAKEDYAAFSVDGQWVIYSSDEGSGRSDIYARSYPAGDNLRLLSSGGGRVIKVADDGSIFFNNGAIVMRVDVTDPETMATGPPVEFVRGVDSEAWDMLPDGTGVVTVQRRPQPQLRLILGAAALFPQR